MSYINAVRFLKGYLTVTADGVFTERFVNICIRRNLEIWDVRRMGTERLNAKMSIDAFKEIRQVCRRTKTRVRITGRVGLPFLAKRIKKRKGAFIGIIIVLTVLWYVTGHIMGITVFGNNRIPTETILEHLARSGIAPGEPTDGIDTDAIRNRMMIDLDELAWVGINVSGSRIYVEIVERIEKEKGVDMESPCHLVAVKDGIIESIEARNGQTMVKAKSGVREGDVLVSGIIDSPVTGYSYVHAYGEVYALTEYKKTREYPLEYVKKTDTGQQKTRYTLSVLSKDLPLFLKKKPPYEYYNLEESYREYSLPIEVMPSIGIKKEVYQQQIEEKKNRTAAEALEDGKTELEGELRTEIGDKTIKDIKVSHTLTERGGVEVTVTVVCRENIAKEVPIEKSMP